MVLYKNIFVYYYCLYVSDIYMLYFYFSGVRQKVCYKLQS
jgi:hypothetical protein